ncbi:MAG: hypothetical protein AAF449_21750, partial [Myxococcota bacterium]
MAEATQSQERDVRRDKSTSTMVWAGGRQVRLDIHPVQAGRPVRVILAYEETLTVDSSGLARYRVLLPDAAARTVALFTDGRFTTTASPPGRWSSVGEWRRQDLVRATSQPEWVFRIGRAPVVLRGGDVRMDGTEIGLPDDFYFARVQLPANDPAPVPATQSAVLILDVSRRVDVDGGAARQIALMEQILSQDTSIERYTVLLYSVGARWLHGQRWLDNHSDNRKKTYRAMAEVYRDGASDPSVAVDAILEAPWLGTHSTAFLLTLGPRTWGSPDARIVRRARATAALWRVYALSESAGDELAELAADAGTAVVPVHSGDALSAAATVHRRGPALPLEIRVDGASSTPIGFPSRSPPGAVVHFAGRLAKGVQATATVLLGGRTVAKVAIVGRDPLAARAWAQTSLASWRRQGVASSSWIDVAKWFRLAPVGAAFRVAKDDAPTIDRAAAQDALTRLTDSELPDVDAFVLTPETQRAVQILRSFADRAKKPRPPVELSRSVSSMPTAKDLQALRAIVRERRARDDHDGAVVALAGYAAVRLADAEAQRVVGFTLLAMGRAGAAADVLERLRRRRPFEAQAWLTSGLAFEAAGDPDRALAR